MFIFLYFLKYQLVDRSKGVCNVVKRSDSIVFDYPCAKINDCTPYKLTIQPGKYRFELWGAQGGDSRYWNKDSIRTDSGGKGAYVAGDLNLIGTTELFLFLGGKGEDQASIVKGVRAKGGFNGGGNGGNDMNDDKYPESGAGGGGSTDIRLILDDNELVSLKSRIIVASAGGGAVSANASGYNRSYTDFGFDGGMLIGTGNISWCAISNQTSGLFGKGNDGIDLGTYDLTYKVGGSTGGSGSGYYGGSTFKGFTDYLEGGGTGGSSFISGYEGCSAVEENEDNPPTHVNDSIHYSSIYFTNATMKMKGSEDFLDPYGKEEDGHHGNGTAKITLLKQGVPLVMRTCKYSLHSHRSFDLSKAIK